MNTPDSNHLRILSLEDSATDEELILRELGLGEIKFVSKRVETGEEFEREIAAYQPDLILADYKLPHFDGAKALALAKVRCPDTPVIVISGAVGEETAVELLKNGATDFVLKDRLGRLVPAVKRALREVWERDARRQAEADLRTLNDQLERRVAERTRELCEKNAIMEEDLNMARELQVAFLPHQFPILPRGAEPSSTAVKFCSIFHPTSSVSGDFYNVVRVSDDAVGVFICDVMGHGVRAALVTAMMRTLEEQLGELAGDPGALLTEMNRALRGILRQLGTTLFTTACYVIVDVASGRMKFSNAAHPSPLIVHAGAGAIESITPPYGAGPALGLFEEAKYLTHDCPLAAGDLILAFTDGLFEVENAKAEAFSIDRLRESIRSRASLPLAQLMQDVFSEIEHFAQGQEFSDDVCLIGMEIAHLTTGAAS